MFQALILGLKKNIASTSLLCWSSGTLISKNEALSVTMLHCTSELCLRDTVSHIYPAMKYSLFLHIFYVLAAL